MAYDVRNRKELWSISVDIEDKSTNTHGVVTYPLLAVSEDNQHLLLTHPQELELVDLTNGKTVRSEVFDADVVDVDLTPDGSRVLVTTEHDWVSEGGEDVPETKIISVPREPEGTGSRDEIEVPNCADELVVAPDGGHAFLAPTTCNKDPISVIDLSDNSFVRNLPGFGPVAQSPAGDELVGFLDLDEVDADLFDSPDDIPSGDRYHMMFIDSATLTYDFMELGDSLPRYAMTPDGKVLLIDSTGWFEDERLRVLDIPSRSIETTTGPVVQLDDFVITSDSAHVYLLDGGLFDLDIPARDVDAVSVGFEPENINITPNDTFLLLREDSTRIQIFDLDKGEIARSVEF
jgi:DNA-binding beta-propeller fold protein YncE